jgi:phospholipid/cholesterol/gamma-HCH transport system permease protein
LSIRILGGLGHWSLSKTCIVGESVRFIAGAFARVFRKPARLSLIAEQIFFIGNRSTGLILLTASFTGMVLALQSYNALVRFGGGSFVGPLVALSMVKELGPVLAALMVTGRAGSAITATIGNMRITEQIDALTVLGVDPVHYLVKPRLLAGLIALPILTAIFVLAGIGSAYLFGSHVLGIDGGLFITSMRDAVGWGDVVESICKSLTFAVFIVWISCYRGFHTSHGSQGVGKATTQAVVEISVMILAGDYLMTSLFF